MLLNNWREKHLFLIFSFTLYAFHFTLSRAYALDLQQPKQYFLEGDYKAAIKEGEKILAEADYVPDLDELYYILGLSYFKDGNYLRASDIFEIILNEFKESNLKDEAALGSADAYFALGDSKKAESIYQELSRLSPESKIREQAVTRLNQIFYTVGAGIFSKKLNAQNLAQTLISKGYPALVEEEKSGGKTLYRVIAGSRLSRQQAEDLGNKLSEQGYPAKIFPDAGR